MDASHAIFSAPPHWSLIVGWIGRSAILLGLGLFLVGSILGFLRHRTVNTRPWPSRFFVLGCISLVLSFVSLIVLFVFDRFEFSYISQHTDRGYELYYKVAGVWAGQQGSFLLWATASAIFGLLSFRKTAHYRSWYLITYSIFLAALCGILAYETPFALNMMNGRSFVPTQGAGLVPSLQNYWVVIHPPTIFLGFGALTVLGSWSIAALLTGDLDSWISLIRPWALLALAFLGLGLCMGGFWAYETLGWGGFWMWDPVENTSFVPWCIVVALVHGLLVQSTRGSWRLANAILAGSAFLSFVYGTFLTRSGFLSETSVHSFAEMDKTAHLVLLGFFVLSSLGFILAVIFRAMRDGRTSSSQSEIPERAPSRGVDREFFLLIGVLLLVGFAGAAAFGMSVPLVQTILGREPKVVDEHLYHMGLIWLLVPLLIMVAVGPFASWARKPIRWFLSRVVNIVSLSIGLLGICMVLVSHPTVGMQVDTNAWISGLFGYKIRLFPWMMFLIWLCLLVGVSSIWKLVETRKTGLTHWGAFLSHFGLALLLAGLIISRGFEHKVELRVQEGVPTEGLGFQIAYAGIPVSSEPYWVNLFDRKNKMPFHVVGKAIYQATLSIGDRFEFNGVSYRYTEPTASGVYGQIGCRVGALFVAYQKRILNPSIEIGINGPVHNSEYLDNDRFLLLDRVDKTTRQVRISIHEGFVATPGHYLSILSDGRESPMVWPYIKHFWTHDIYFTLHPQVIEATDKTPFSQGQTKQLGPLWITYEKMIREGAPGEIGTRFNAKLRVQSSYGVESVVPGLRITSEGIEPQIVPAAPGYVVAMSSMDPTSKRVTLQLLYSKPIYQVDLFYKPMTLLVWLGTGILTFGGMLTAFARRPRKAGKVEAENAE
jgi:cytochrome c-type biogenesis protein CcmF